MLKKLAIGCVALAGVYALVSGDYTFAGPRYQVLAYAYLAAAQFDDPRPATEDAGTENAETRNDVGGTPAAAPHQGGAPDRPPRFPGTAPAPPGTPDRFRPALDGLVLAVVLGVHARLEHGEVGYVRVRCGGSKGEEIAAALHAPM